MNDRIKVFVAGHTGLVGAALVRRLSREADVDLLLRSRRDLDLTHQQSVTDFFFSERPQQVYLAAARVGGITDNASHPADFIRDNLLIQTHLIDAAYRSGVEKLLFLGSSCIYPRLAPQPIKEEYLLTGALEVTNRAYALAKIAGLEMCRSYRQQYDFRAISAMPTNLYGPGDNFLDDSSHVIPALFRRFAVAKKTGQNSVKIWGSGTPRREFLHVDDLADALVWLMKRYEDPEIINVGCGEDISIAELAKLIANIVGFDGFLEFDSTFPDGTPRKLLDTTKLTALGWRPQIGLRAGLAATWEGVSGAL